MNELQFFRVFNLVAGVIGLAIGMGVILVPQAISRIEKNLDKTFSTEKIEKLLNARKNLSEILLKHPRIFGFILFFISFFLILGSLLSL